MIQFYKRTLLFFAIIASPFILHAQQFKVVGYLNNWNSFVENANNIDYSKVTHINIAFINPTNTNGDLGPTTSLTTVVDIIHNNNVKVLASMGGANTPSSLAGLLQSANRTAFIAKIVKFVEDYKLDGVDIDFEGDAVDANYAAFISELHTELKKKDKLLTAALGTWYANKISNTTLTYFDWVNIMTYDAYGTWTNYGEHSTYQFAINDFNYWKNTKGLSKSQMVLGVPFYGYIWESNYKSSLSYCSIIDTYPRAVNKDTINTPTGGKISYNGVPTIKQKTSLALEQGAGIMFWTIDMDCPTTNSNSLLLAINQTINDFTNNIAPVVTLTGPANGGTYEEGDVIRISADASDEDGTISMVAFYQGTIKIGEDNTAPYFIDWIAEAGTYTIHAKALDNVPTTSSSSSITLTVNPTAEQKPYRGTPWNIPGKVEVEEFDFGSELGYHDIDAANKGGAFRSTSVDIEACSDNGGGYNIGYVAPGEWLEYTTTVEKDSLYDIEIRYATNNPSGGTLSIDFDETDVTGNVSIPMSNGWQTWASKTIRKVRLYEGDQIMRVTIESGEYNLNYVKVTYNDPLANIFKGNDYNNNLSIYPNPVENQSTLKLSLTESGMAHVAILDLTGKELMTLPEQYLTNGVNSITIDGSNLKTGLYLCRVIHNGKVSTIAFTKN